MQRNGLFKFNNQDTRDKKQTIIKKQDTNTNMKNFDKWNSIKKALDSKDDRKIFYPKPREVWVCAIGKNIGVEQNGAGNNFSRPVLIVNKFNNK